MGAGGPGGDDVRAHPVDVERRAHQGDLVQDVVAELDRRQQRLGRFDGRGQLGFVGGEPRGERGRVGVVGDATAHDLRARHRVTRRGDLDGEPEAVEQLRAQLALLGVHGAYQQESRRMAHRHALALDVAGAERGGVEQQVDEVVVQQVDLVDVENATMGRREQSRLERLHALGQCPLEVERADEPILTRADRQFDQAGRPLLDQAIRGVRPVRALRVGRRDVAGEPAARHHRHRRQHRGERTYRRRLGGAFLPAHEDAADGRGDGVQDQGEAEIVHADDGTEREGGHGTLSM